MCKFLPNKMQLGTKNLPDKIIKVNGKDKTIVNSSGWIIYHGKYFITLANPQVTTRCKMCGTRDDSGKTVYRSKLECNRDYCEKCVLLREQQYIKNDLEKILEERVLSKDW